MRNKIRAFVAFHNWRGPVGRLLLRLTGWSGKAYYLYFTTKGGVTDTEWKFHLTRYGWKAQDCYPVSP